MVVERKNEAGQSVIEFLILMPMMVAIFVLMARSNMAIQRSIVNQQYGRMQLHLLAYNSPNFPALSSLRIGMTDRGYNRLVLGVSENHIPPGGGQPEATIQRIHRNPAVAGSDAPQQEPSTRGFVRVRTALALCTQLNVLGNNSDSPKLINSGSPPNQVLSNATSVLKEDLKVSFCGGPIDNI